MGHCSSELYSGRCSSISTCTSLLSSVLPWLVPMLPLRLMLSQDTLLPLLSTMPIPTGPESPLPTSPPPVLDAVERGLLMLMLMPTTDTPMLMDMDILMLMDTEPMDTPT